MSLTDTDLDLLCRVGEGSDEGDVSWRRTASGRSFRLWTSAYQYEVVTPRAKRLIEAGLAEVSHGYRLGAGWLKLTLAGRAALRAADRYAGRL